MLQLENSIFYVFARRRLCAHRAFFSIFYTFFRARIFLARRRKYFSRSDKYV